MSENLKEQLFDFQVSARQSEGPIVRMPNSPKARQSESLKARYSECPIVQRSDIPNAQQSEGSIVRRSNNPNDLPKNRPKQCTVEVKQIRLMVHYNENRVTFVTVTTLIQKFAIVAKLCFFNLLYYCEVRYPISNKGNQSFLNLDIQRLFTKNA